MRTVHKPPHGSQEWLDVRWRDENNLARISASVAAAVHGCHPYTTGADLAVELLAEHAPTPTETNRAMERGNTLEGPLRDWASKLLGKWLGAPCVMYVYEEDGVRLIATLDAVSEHGEVFEIKTKRGRWNGELPPMWYWQGVHQAICADVDKITWVIFDSDLDIQFHEQVVTSDEKRIHIEACRKFLSYIDMGMVPDDVQMNYQNVQDRFQQSDGTIREIDATGFNRYRELQAIIATAESEADELKTALCREMGDASFGHVDGELVCTWKTIATTKLDAKALELQHPALVDRFKKQTTYRTFRVVKKKGE